MPDSVGPDAEELAVTTGESADPDHADICCCFFYLEPVLVEEVFRNGDPVAGLENGPVLYFNCMGVAVHGILRNIAWHYRVAVSS